MGFVIPDEFVLATAHRAGAHDSCTFIERQRQCNLWQVNRVIPDSPFTLVLSGGGLKGLAHIGVLRALEERGLVPSLVVGSSIGSLIKILSTAWNLLRPAAGIGSGRTYRDANYVPR